MKRIFRPAIYLMNQLQYTKKFMVLGAIFLIAIMEVIYGFTTSMSATIRTAQQELDGLVIIQPMIMTMQLMQQHRGLTNGVLGGNNSMREQQELKEQKLVKLFNDIDKKLPIELLNDSEWKAIKLAWENIHAGSQSSTIDKSWVGHTQLIEQLHTFNAHIADYFSLSSDPAINVHYLLDTTILDMPESLELLAKMRGYGAGILAQKKMTENQSFNLRVLMAQHLLTLKSLAVNLKKTSLYNPQIKLSITDALRIINLSSQQIISLIESDILTENFITPSNQFFTEASFAIDVGNEQLHDVLIPAAMTLINERKHQAENVRLYGIGFAIVSLLLAYYLFISIYYSMIDTVQSLASSARKLANGDLDERVSLNTQDELKVIGDSFNEMATGFNALMQTHIEDELRLQAILDGAMDASIQMDAQGNVKRWSRQAQEVFGWSSEEVVGCPLQNFIIPVRYHELYKQVLEESFHSGEDHAIESRIEIAGRHKSGHEISIELAITQIRTASEIEYNAFVRDISDRKVSEYELRIAAIAFEALEGMVVTDAKRIILKVNKAFTDITGYSAEEAVGKSHSIVKSDRHNEAFYQEMWIALKQHKFWMGEIWNKRKSGEVFPQLLRITAVTDKHGTVSNYVAAFTDISESKNSEDALNTLAFYDPLTHLPNRKLMLEQLHREQEASEKSMQYCALLALNLDSFKLLNDTKGHYVGDLMLIEVAKRLQTCISLKDTVSRIGGDEFVVLLSGLAIDSLKAYAQVESVTERIQAALGLSYKILDNEYHNSACVGICLFSNQDISADEIFKRAGAAMHRAKQSGPRSIRFFDLTAQNALETRVQLESWLRNAIPDQFLLFYQPQVDAAGRIIGAEALIRWLHPENGLISPVMFIPLAEETDLILPIGDWVMETACKQLKQWEANPMLQHLQLSVNVSAKQFQKHDFVAKVQSLLQLTGANPAKLKLELTESLLVSDVDTIIVKMEELKVIGVSFSLDDFGTGFSSLSYLKRLPLNQLKIDQSFVRNLLNDANDEAIVRMVIALGYAMGISVIAEGVETIEQRDFLCAHGCHFYQGYLFGKPLEIKSFESLINPRFSISPQS